VLQNAHLPKLGDTADDVVVIEWLAKIGDRVEQGGPLVRVETSKVELDVESPLSGIVRDHLVPVDAEVATGSAIAVIETADPA